MSRRRVTTSPAGMNTAERQQAFFAWHDRVRRDIQRLLDCIERRDGLDRLMKIVQESFGERAAAAVRELEAPRQMPGTPRRIVSVGTAAAGSTLALPARAHTFFGAE